MHGVELIRAVIEHLNSNGFGKLSPRSKPKGLPRAKLDALTFPHGKPLSPALKEWLAYDARFLGFFEDPNSPAFQPTSFEAWTRDEYKMDWGFGALQKRLGGDCFPVPLGTDSRRCLYVGETDSVGEYPVLLIDVDDIPYVGVQYPGIDVYLATAVGLTTAPERVYGSYAKDQTYGPRMKEHGLNLFDGKTYLEFHDFG